MAKEIMRISRPLLLLLASPLFLTLTLADEPSVDQVDLAKFGDPPAGTIQHYEWCLAAKGLEDQTALLRAFWEENHPGDVGYGDSIHIRMELLAAYRLVENYARMNRPNEVIKILNWIKSEDERLMEEERAPFEGGQAEPVDESAETESPSN